MLTAGSMIQSLDGRELSFLADLLRNYLAGPFIDFVSPRVAPGGDDSVKAAVNERYGTVVFNRDTDAPGPPNHVPEMFSARDSTGPTVVVRAVNSLDESQTLYVDVLPISRIIKRH